MHTYIKKLQSKSENTRKQILVGSLIVSMSFVFLIWISSIGHKFSNETVAKTEENIKPFALFGQTIKDTYSNVTASVGNIGTSLKKDEPKVEPKVEEQKQIDLIPVEYQ
jgi:hypothetical protein